MCQCGCAERPVEKAYQLTRRCVLGVKVYDGCQECFQGLAVDLTVFDSAKVEWLEGVKIDHSVHPSQYGGSNPASGIPVPVIDVDALREQAKEMEAEGGIAAWESFDAWLEEEGLRLLQGAARKFAVRYAGQVAELAAREPVIASGKEE